MTEEFLRSIGGYIEYNEELNSLNSNTTLVDGNGNRSQIAYVNNYRSNSSFAFESVDSIIELIIDRGVKNLHNQDEYFLIEMKDGIVILTLTFGVEHFIIITNLDTALEYIENTLSLRRINKEQALLKDNYFNENLWPSEHNNSRLSLYAFGDIRSYFSFVGQQFNVIRRDHAMVQTTTLIQRYFGSIKAFKPTQTIEFCNGPRASFYYIETQIENNDPIIFEIMGFDWKNSDGSFKYLYSFHNLPSQHQPVSNLPYAMSASAILRVASKISDHPNRGTWKDLVLPYTPQLRDFVKEANASCLP